MSFENESDAVPAPYPAPAPPLDKCSQKVNCDKRKSENNMTCSQWKNNNLSLDQFVKMATTPNFLGEIDCASKSKAEAFYKAVKKCYCGLSTGTIVGIVIGSLAFIVIVVFIVLQMRKKQGMK